MRAQQPWRTNRARTLRSNKTSAEDVLWQKLRARRLGGFKFVRQAPIATYFVDFLCREAKFVVELDGATHGTKGEIEADETRTYELKQLGYEVTRVSNAEVFENLTGVCETLLARLEPGLQYGDDDS